MTDAGGFMQEPARAAARRPPRISDDRLVQAKLSRPEMPAGYVDRPRLRTALDAATRSPVTLMTGGPGWGKTVLLASWAAGVGSKRAVVWLTLDVDDDEPRVFWAYVLAALKGSGAVPPDSALASLDPRNGLSAVIYRRIQAGLSQLRHEVVLVLDDVSNVRSRGVHEQIARLNRYESPLRVVLVSRAEPPLILNRLRVAGALAEIGTGELAFTAAEAGELLAGQGVSVDVDEVAQLLERTEGWATGLRLAAMFLRRPGARPADFGGGGPGPGALPPGGGGPRPP